MVLPIQRERQALLEHLLQGERHEINRRELSVLATDTEGWSPSDLLGLARTASMQGVREAMSRKHEVHDAKEVRPIKIADFYLAMQILAPDECAGAGEGDGASGL